MKIALSLIAVIAVLAIGAGSYLYFAPSADDPMANFSDAKRAAIEARAEKQAQDAGKETLMVDDVMKAKAAQQQSQ